MIDEENHENHFYHKHDDDVVQTQVMYDISHNVLHY